MNKNYQFTKEQEERFRLETVRRDGFSIRYLDNPSEEVQLEAVKQEAYAIEYIKNPSEELQLEAVRQNWHAIQYIVNPSEQVQLEAIRQNGYSINFIKNPSDYIKSVLDIIRTFHRDIYILHEPDKEPLFTIGCQKNISKDYFIWRIYNMDGGLEENPYRQEYLDIIERY